ncbi:MAG: WG repeat-containing protein [Anaerolineae bacterium]|nr:WG repeat-containing protein [Anaerolineae bacterium]
MFKHLLRLSLIGMLFTIYAVLSMGQTTSTLAQDTAPLYRVEQNGKWGFIDTTGHVVIAPQFESTYGFSHTNIAPVKIKGQWGFIDRTGRVIIPPIFKDIPTSVLDRLPSVEDGLIFYQDADTHLLTVLAPPNGKYVLGQYDAVNHVKNAQLFAVERDQKWGFVDETGKVLVDVKYDSAYSLGGLLVVTQNKLSGFIDEAGKSITAIQYQALHGFSEGFAAVKLDSRWGYIDRAGTMVIPPTYVSDRSFSGGLAAVKINDKWGFIDPTGKIVSQPTFDKVSDYRDGAAWVLVQGKWGMIDAQGKIIIEPKFDGVFPADDNLDFEYGYSTIPYPFSEDAAPVRFGRVSGLSAPYGKAGLIDRTSKFLLEAQYDNVHYAGANRFAFEQDGKWGLVDNLGKIVIKPTFESHPDNVPGCLITFSSNRACVQLGGKYGFIDTTGSVVIQPKYDLVRAFDGALSLVFVKQDPKYPDLMGYIDLNGNEVWPPSR